MEKQYLSPLAFAQRLEISRWTVYAWIEQGRINTVKLGRLVRIPESELARLVNKGSAEKEQ